MKSIIFLTTLLFSLHTNAKCPSFSYAQERLLYMAFYKGAPKDLGYTLASIVWQESFVGSYIVKVNNRYDKVRNKHYESYGITHIELTTAMYLMGMDNGWKARAELVPLLINNDELALELALDKLYTLRRHPWRKKVEKYNGGSVKYGKMISDKVETLKNCYKLEERLEYE